MSEIAAKESQLLSQWGVYIRSQKNPGPGEKRDPISGEYGTKPHPLAKMQGNSRDEDDEIHFEVENYDRCELVSDFVMMMPSKTKAALFGWFCEWPFMIDVCLNNVEADPEGRRKLRYNNAGDFYNVLNQGVTRVERSYQNMLAYNIKADLANN